MRITIVVGLLLVFRCAALGKGIDRRVERGSELEKELGYTLSGQDKHGEWRSQGMDKLFPIEGLAAEYMLKFHATAADKLKDLIRCYPHCEACRRDRGAGPLGDQVEVQQGERSRCSVPPQERHDRRRRIGPSL